MLLVQGSGSYDWETIFNHSPKKDHVWESGIEISGKVLDADLSKERLLWLYPKKIEDAFVCDINDNKTFFSKAFLYKNDSLAVSVSDARGRMRKPSIDLAFGTLNATSDLNFSEIKGYSSSRKYRPITAQFEKDDKTIFLEEVEVKAPDLGIGFKSMPLSREG